MRRLFALPVCLALAGCIELLQDETSEPNVILHFNVDESQDGLTVVAAGPDLPWTAFNVTGDKVGMFRLNDGPPRQFTKLNSKAVGDGTAQAGDRIEFCLQQRGPLEGTIRHTPSESVVHTFRFERVEVYDWCD